MKQRHQVVIVGGGPVGVALAVELGQRGISCALVERRLTPQRIPKGQGLTQRSMEHFYFWGVADKIRAARLLPPEFPTSGVTAYKNLMSEFWYAPPLREIVNHYYFQEQERLPQYLTEEVLRARMAELPNVESAFGWAAQSVTQDEVARASPLPKNAVPGTKHWKPTTSSAAMAAILWCASRSASNGAAPTSTSSWCLRCCARANSTRGSSAFPRARHFAPCIRTSRAIGCSSAVST